MLWRPVPGGLLDEALKRGEGGDMYFKCKRTNVRHRTEREMHGTNWGESTPASEMQLCSGHRERERDRAGGLGALFYRRCLGPV